MLNQVAAIHGAPAAPVVLNYSDTVLADSPLGFWLFDETSGSTLTDQGSGLKNMTAYNTPTLNVSTGLTGIPKTISFNPASDEYASTGLQSTYNLAPSANWTVEGWFSTTETFDTDSVFAIRGNQIAGDNGDILCAAFINVTLNKLSILVTNSAGNGYIVLTSSTTISTGSFFYFTVTSTSSGALKLYINGVEEASSTASRYTGTNSRAFIAAAQSNGASSIQNYFNGKCMAPAIYNTTLSTTRITEHYNKGI